MLLIVLASQSSYAQLFKWVDENGKIHYSDKVPEGHEGAQVGGNSNSSSSATVGYNKVKPIIRPYEKTARRLHLLDVQYRWKSQAEVHNTAKLGTYHVGKACASRGAITTPDVFVYHKEMFPEEKHLSRIVRDVIQGLDYEIEHTQKYKLLERLKNTGGLSLHAEIVGMNVKACAPGLRKSERLTPIEQISYHRFTRNRVNLQVHWQLRTNRDQTVLYDSQTIGEFNGWNLKERLEVTIGKAVEKAALVLFSDTQFIARILVEEDSKVAGGVAFASSKPIQPSGKTSNLFVAVDRKNWANSAAPNSEIGNLLYGDKCAAARPMPLKFALQKQPWLMPREAEIRQLIVDAGRPLGYAVNPSTHDTLSKLEQTNGLSLNAKLYKLTYDSCAPSLSASEKYKPIKELTFKRMNRKRIQVWIEWTLKTDRNTQLLYRTSTMGFAGDLVAETRGKEAMQEAIGMATEQLFADPRFVELLAISGPDLPSDQPFARRQDSEVQGILLDPGQEAKLLLVVTAKDPWKSISKLEIGQYAFGEDCIPFRQREWPQTLNETRKHFPKGHDLAIVHNQVIKSFGYPARISTEYTYLNEKRRLDAYSLHPEIVDMRFDSCATIVDEDEVFSGRRIGQHKYSRHRVALKVRWKLKGEDEAGVLFQKTVEGVADSWHLNSLGDKVVKLAMEDSITRLFASPDFVAALLVQPPVPEEEKGFFSNLFSMFESDDAESAVENNAGSNTYEDKLINSMVIKSEATKALVDLTPLKMQMQTHYMSEGSWPASLYDMGLSTMFYDNPGINEVHVSADGSIVAELNEKFGSNKMITLQATSTSGRDWTCTSNLDQIYIPRACESR